MSTEQSNNAVVIGAGIVGTCTAYELSKSGYNVTVIERFPLAAQFCSMGNAGVIRDRSAPSFKSLEPNHSTLHLMWEAFKSILPTFKPHYKTFSLLDPYFFTDMSCNKWLYTFFKSKLKSKPNQEILDYYDTFCLNAYISNANELKHIFDYDFLSNTGYAKIFPSLDSISNIKTTKHLFKQLNERKLKHLCLTTDATQETIDNITYEIYPKSFINDCHKFSNSIAKIKDINFRFNSEAQEILVDKDKNVCGIKLRGNEIIETNKVIICAGVVTNNIIKNKIFEINEKMERKKKIKLGVYIPIIPLQGFSVSIAYSTNRHKYPFNSAAYYPSYIYASRINENILRFSSYGYFRSNKYAINVWNNIQNIIEKKEGIQSNITNISKFENMLWNNLENCVKDNLLYLYDINDKYFDENKIRWTGFRPYTPDELPIVDKINGINGLYVNAGHGMLGWGMSHGTAKLLVTLINNQTNQKENKLLKLLSLDRF